MQTHIPKSRPPSKVFDAYLCDMEANIAARLSHVTRQREALEALKRGADRGLEECPKETTLSIVDV